MATYNKPEDADSELHQLLLRAVPENENGNKTLNHLAKLMSLSKWAIRKWINSGKIPPERAMQVVKLSGGRVSIQEFHPFVYKD